MNEVLTYSIFNITNRPEFVPIYCLGIYTYKPGSIPATRYEWTQVTYQSIIKLNILGIRSLFIQFTRDLKKLKTVFQIWI